MSIWLLLALFGLFLWGAFARKGSAAGAVVTNIGVVAAGLIILFFAVLLGIGALTAS